MKDNQFICQVGFEDFVFDCIIGVYPEERDLPQPLAVTLRCSYDATRAAQGDDVQFAVDYAGMSEVIMQTAQEGEYYLLETLAQEVIRALRARWPQVVSGRLELRKPRALSRAGASLLVTEF